MDLLRLDEQIDKQIENYWIEGGNFVYNKKYLEAKELMEKAWEMLPEPKEIYFFRTCNNNPSYHISEILTQSLIGLQQFDEAQIWLEIHKKTDMNARDDGEKDFLEGEFFYAQHEIEKAKSCFEKANKKSGGRIFQRKDRKQFKELLSKENIRPTTLTELIKVAKREIKSKNYADALDLLYDALNLNQVKVEVHFNKGLCHFELEEFDHAADSFTRAYMLDGETIFKKNDAKYFEFLKAKIELEVKVEPQVELQAAIEIEPKIEEETLPQHKEETEKPKKKPWWKF